MHWTELITALPCIWFCLAFYILHWLAFCIDYLAVLLFTVLFALNECVLYEQAALYILAGGEHLDKEREDVEEENGFLGESRSPIIDGGFKKSLGQEVTI